MVCFDHTIGEKKKKKPVKARATVQVNQALTATTKFLLKLELLYNGCIHGFQGKESILGEIRRLF
jgi:hypothetical protein